jgi:hypothetical protein
MKLNDYFKKLILTLVVLAGSFTVSLGQSTDKKETIVEKKATEMKDHLCTDACKEAGKCVHAHGEKGHTCDMTCAEDMKGSNHKGEGHVGHGHEMKMEMEMKAHECSADAHGEKGHTCTSACMKMPH